MSCTNALEANITPTSRFSSTSSLDFLSNINLYNTVLVYLALLAKNWRIIQEKGNRIDWITRRSYILLFGCEGCGSQCGCCCCCSQDIHLLLHIGDVLPGQVGAGVQPEWRLVGGGWCWWFPLGSVEKLIFQYLTLKLQHTVGRVVVVVKLS